MRVCLVDDCTSPAKTRGWCNKHYKRWLRNGDPIWQTISCNSCNELQLLDGGSRREYCDKCSKKEYDPLTNTPISCKYCGEIFEGDYRRSVCDVCRTYRICSIEGCERLVTSAHGVCFGDKCSGHCLRNRGIVDASKPIRNKSLDGVFINSKGYRVLPGSILEHRSVMENILGRPLKTFEEVHHKNGVRSDNYEENLELWSTSQPAGQRVEDKIKWAKELLGLYYPDYEAEEWW